MRLLVPPPVVGLTCAGLMWGTNWLLPGMASSFPGQMLLAGALAAVGVFFDVTALLNFRKAKTTVNPLDPDQASALVADGLYRFTRNPMYFGLGLILAGWAVWLGNPLNVIVLAAFVFYITEFQIKPEEEILRRKFGAGYEVYSKRVRRWI